MKYIFIALLSLTVAAQAETTSNSSVETLVSNPGTTHMIQFAVGAATNSKYEYEDYNESTTNSIALVGGYGYQLPQFERVQILGRASISYGDYNSGWYKSSSLAVGAGYNFNKDITDSIFVNVLAGITTDEDEEDSDTNPSQYVEFGKRFNLGFLGLDFASYSPQITYTHENEEDYNDNSWSFNLLKFDFFL